MQEEVWKENKTNIYYDALHNIQFTHSTKKGKDTKLTYMFHDGRGNVAGVINNGNGEVYDYESYGELGDPQNTDVLKRNKYTLTQKHLDTNSNLYYFGARFYDPANGVWMTQDTYRGDPMNPMSMQRYMYNYNSPVNYVDRDGRSPALIGGLLYVGGSALLGYGQEVVSNTSDGFELTDLVEVDAEKVVENTYENMMYPINLAARYSQVQAPNTEGQSNDSSDLTSQEESEKTSLYIETALVGLSTQAGKIGGQVVKSCGAVLKNNSVVKNIVSNADDVGKKLTNSGVKELIEKSSKRFFKKAPKKAIDFNTEYLSDESIRLSYKVPADNIPGSYAEYIKVIGKNGNTIKVEKITYAPDGSIVHTKIK